MTAWILLYILPEVPLVSSSGGSGAVRETCQSNIVETIPSTLDYSEHTIAGPRNSIHLSLLEMINQAQRTIKIVSRRISLTRLKTVKDPLIGSTDPGNEILEALEEASKRGVKLAMVVGIGQHESDDMKRLSAIGQVHYLVQHDGLGYKSEMHSKFVIVDDENFYLGSASLAWDSLSLDKSFGVTFLRCKSLARDLNKIFQTYVLISSALANGDEVELPERLNTKLNLQNPMNITTQGVNSHTYKMFLSSSFPTLTDNQGRTSDLDALINIIDNAKVFIYISAPEYTEEFVYSAPTDYWPVISDALKRASFERGVKVRLLVDQDRCYRGGRSVWIKSLGAMSNVGGGIIPRTFWVPGLDYKGYKTDNYVLTDRALYIGTGSWTADHLNRFTTTGLVIEPTTIRNKALLNQVEQRFSRDYYSRYTIKMDKL